MTAFNEKAPAAAMPVAGAGTRQPKSTSGNHTTGISADESLALIRRSQVLIRGIAQTLDRMSDTADRISAEIARAVSR